MIDMLQVGVPVAMPTNSEVQIALDAIHVHGSIDSARRPVRARTLYPFEF